MKLNATFILRVAVSIVLVMHSIPGIFNNGINDFGNLYLNQIGFAPLGIPIAWAIKLSHIAAAVCFLMNRFVRPAAVVTIFIMVMGLIMVHWPEGWYVVGGGRNGIEFNFLMIAILLTLMFPNGFSKK